MENQTKCSNKKHSDINAINYCIECNLYLCNKCTNYHSELLDAHHLYNIDKIIEDIFTGICKESNHKEELEFYCKTHNKLCCAACLSKIKGKGSGQHFDCDVCLLEEIKEEKKKKLTDNIKYLEEFYDKIKNTINEIKKIFENINEKKEEIKLKISQVFTKIRNIINEREDEILLEVENIFNKTYFKEDIIKQSDKIPDKMKIFLEKGKLLEKEWDDDNSKLNSRINDCINIDNNIKNIMEINENIIKCNSQEINIKFIPEEDEEINKFLEQIKTFGEVINDDKFKFKFRPGSNYKVTNNGLIATKNSGGSAWNCIIYGDKEIPKNKISKWKIRINSDISGKLRDLYIGIGLNNAKGLLYDFCWSFICSHSEKKLRGETLKYNNLGGKLNKGDIVEVIVDRKLNNLSFSINGTNQGIACSQIPKDDILYPTVIIYEQNHEIEIV